MPEGIRGARPALFAKRLRILRISAAAKVIGER
jgi:hypothetical protein